MLTSIITGAFQAALAIFFGLVYFIGCVLIVVLSPKICKGLFAGSSNLGALIGAALTAVTSAAMGLGRVGVATGAFGSGSIGQIASSLFDGPRRGPTTDPAPPSGIGSDGKSRPASMEAILATSTPAGAHRTPGGASGRPAGRRPTSDAQHPTPNVKGDDRQKP